MTMPDRPIMRIALSVSDAEAKKGADSPYLRALRAVCESADQVEMVAPSTAAGFRVDDFDGILFAGGADVDPMFYGEHRKYDNVQVDRARDDFELEVLRRALHRRLPILGICRGAQLINVSFGGTLYQDLAEEAEPEFEHRQTDAGNSRNETTHAVTVTEPDSALAGAVHGSCRVNSIHHQAIKRLGHGLKVTAHSEDGLVEAVEGAGDYPFLLAVQWHPEEIVDRPEQRRIFEQFLAKCREAAERRHSAAASH